VEVDVGIGIDGGVSDGRVSVGNWLVMCRGHHNQRAGGEVLRGEER